MLSGGVDIGFNGTDEAKYWVPICSWFYVQG